MTRGTTPKKAWHLLRVWEKWARRVDDECKDIMRFSSQTFGTAELSLEDQQSFELDLDQVMAQVSVALEAGLANIDTEDWTYSRERWADADEQELRRALEKLKDEMRELKKELKKVKDD